MVDFWAPWCGPCRMVGPIVEALAQQYQGRAFVAKVNVDEESDAAAAYRVASIPTLILFKDGQEQERLVGARARRPWRRCWTSTSCKKCGIPLKILTLAWYN